MQYDQVIINTDGGARGNPGPAAVGVVAKQHGGGVLFEISEYVGEVTNNVAEYTAVIQALEYLQKYQIIISQLTFVLDSELIVRQITGRYRVKEPRLQTLVTRVQNQVSSLKLSGNLKSVNFINVPRAQNKRADQLVNQALDSRK